MDHDQTLRLLIAERRMLQAWVRAMVSDAHLVEDILQEVYVVALQKREDFEEGTNFRAWVREITRRVTLSQSRKEGRGPMALDPETLEALDPGFDAPPDRWEDERKALRDCVGKLPEPGRQAVSLRYGNDSSLKDIASAIGRTHEGVKQLLKRVRQTLSKCVEAKLGPTGVVGNG